MAIIGTPTKVQRAEAMRTEFIREIGRLISVTETDTAHQLAEIIVDNPKVRAAIIAAATVEDLHERLREIT